MDFYSNVRQQMISTMQISLRQVRQVLGIGVQAFADLVGLTRQSINNFETQKAKMSAVHYLAVCAVIDNCIKKRPELLSVIATILCSKSSEGSANPFSVIEGDSLLQKWFLCFPDSYMLSFSESGSPEGANINCYTLAENYRIFIDDTALLRYNFDSPPNSLNEAMESCGNKYIVPLRAVDKIQLRATYSNEDIMTQAKNALRQIARLQKRDLIDMRGEVQDSGISDTIISVFKKFKQSNRLALITDDRERAERVNSLNNEVPGFKIQLLRFGKDGYLANWSFDETCADEKASISHEINLNGWGSI